MKYEIEIEGGFSNIPKKFEGEIELDKNSQKELIRLFEVSNENESTIPDGFSYHFLMIDDKNKMYKARFNEKNLPENLRSFVQKIKLNSENSKKKQF